MKYLLLFLFLAGCATTELVEKPVENYKAVWRNEEWSQHVAATLETEGADMLKVDPKDEVRWCPGLSKMSLKDRKKFYVYLVSAMAKYESSFKPETKYTESFTDSSGRKVISRGLLQISLESSKGYGCGFTTGEEMHDPKKNLACGVKILNRWIGRDKYIGSAGVDGIKNAGGARYWSVLRTSSGSQSKIKALTVPFCKSLQP